MIVKDLNRTLCMECKPSDQTLFINNCNNTNKFQKWEWGLKNQTMFDNWLTNGDKIL
jgi:hypothetical protein